MTSTPRPRYTLLIPTFNRPAYLRSLLGYLAARRFAYPIRILDSSSAEALSQNKEAISKSGLDIVHQTYETTIPGATKFADGTQSVDTPYCSFCPDDDILFTSHLEQLLDLLDANPAWVAAHGNYINFRPGNDFDISDIFYWAPSIAADDPLKRIVEQMANYQAIFYAIHRTSVMRSVQSQLARVHSGLANELLSSTLTLIAGGVYRLPQFYMARNTSPSVPSHGWHPYHFLATKPDLLFREYAAYRAVVLEHLLADTACQATYRPEEMQRILDLVHLKYLTPMMSTPVLDYIIAESLRPGSAPRNIVMGIWDNFVTPPDGRVISIRGFLGKLWGALRQPSQARKLMNYAIRFVHIFIALALRRDLKIHTNRELTKIYVDRIPRDGRCRRYVLFRDFLDRRMPGGRRVTAAETISILEELDDYV
jgi:glycosyltransferase domain-containing protein